MIKKDLINEIKNKTGYSIPSIYRLIDKKMTQMNYLVTKKQAAALLAGENGVNLTKVLTDDELKEIRNIKGISITPIIKQQTNQGRKEKSVSLKLHLPTGIKIKDPLLPQSIVDDSSKMANVYLMIYLFENSVRNLIKSVLDTKYGNNWWDSKISTQVSKYVKDRMRKEKENRWHGKRGAHPIFYTDIGDLNSIISKNWEDFKKVVEKEQSWIKHKIEEIEFSRNVIAHNNPLTSDDIQRLEVNFKDWFKQIGSYQAK